MKQAGVKVVVYQPYYNADASNELASKAGGDRRGDRHRGRWSARRQDVFSKFDVLVSSIANALSEK